MEPQKQRIDPLAREQAQSLPKAPQAQKKALDQLPCSIQDVAVQSLREEGRTKRSISKGKVSGIASAVYAQLASVSGLIAEIKTRKLSGEEIVRRTIHLNADQIRTIKKQDPSVLQLETKDLQMAIQQASSDERAREWGSLLSRDGAVETIKYFISSLTRESLHQKETRDILKNAFSTMSSNERIECFQEIRNPKLFIDNVLWGEKGLSNKEKMKRFCEFYIAQGLSGSLANDKMKAQFITHLKEDLGNDYDGLTTQLQVLQTELKEQLEKDMKSALEKGFAEKLEKESNIHELQKFQKEFLKESQKQHPDPVNVLIDALLQKKEPHALEKPEEADLFSKEDMIAIRRAVDPFSQNGVRKFPGEADLLPQMNTGLIEALKKVRES